MPTHFEKDARRATLRNARREALALGSATIEAEHLLLALARDEDAPAGRLLADSNLDHDALCAALERETDLSLAAVGIASSEFALSRAPTPPRRSPRLAASSKRALERAARFALGRKDRRVTAAHLLVGILRTDIGTVPRALAAADADRLALSIQAKHLLD